MTLAIGFVFDLLEAHYDSGGEDPINNSSHLEKLAQQLDSEFYLVDEDAEQFIFAAETRNKLSFDDIFASVFRKKLDKLKKKLCKHGLDPETPRIVRIS